MAFKQDLHFAIDSSIGGTGTVTDPFHGPTGTPAWFDDKMKTVLPNQTVRLGPGEFSTMGTSPNGDNWTAKSGMRILGSGISATTLKLVTTNGQYRFAIGMKSYPEPLVPLTSFEASDFTVDCGFSSSAPAWTANTAVAVFGNHIYLRNLKVINFGGMNHNPVVAVEAGGRQTENAGLDSCIVEAPDNFGDTPAAIMIAFRGFAAEQHRYCFVRNCVCRGPGTGALPAIRCNLFGISSGAAVGFIAEHNQVLNAQAGIYDLPGTQDASDIILRHNHFRNVTTGIDFPNRTWPFGRLIAHDNLVEGVGIEASPGHGMRFVSSLAWPFQALILRKNIIRDALLESTTLNSWLTGIKVDSVAHLTIESNLINNAPGGAGVTIANNSGPNAKRRLFNNRDTLGELVIADTP